MVMPGQYQYMARILLAFIFRFKVLSHTVKTLLHVSTLLMHGFLCPVCYYKYKCKKKLLFYHNM